MESMEASKILDQMGVGKMDPMRAVMLDMASRSEGEIQLWLVYEMVRLRQDFDGHANRNLLMDRITAGFLGALPPSLIIAVAISARILGIDNPI